MPEATIRVKSIKFTAVVKPELIPRDLVPMEGPAGELVLNFGLENGPISFLARMNGKNFRKMIKTIDANNGNVSVVLQGNLQSLPQSNKYMLESAGFQVIPKQQPLPEAPNSEP